MTFPSATPPVPLARPEPWSRQRERRGPLPGQRASVTVFERRERNAR